MYFPRYGHLSVSRERPYPGRMYPYLGDVTLYLGSENYEANLIIKKNRFFPENRFLVYNSP